MLEEHVKTVTAEYHTLNDQLKRLETEIAKLKELKKHIIHYAATKKIYTEYQQSGYSADFYEAHVSEILLHQTARTYFKENVGSELPTLKVINAQLNQLHTTKRVDSDTLRYRLTRMRKAQIVEINTTNHSIREHQNGLIKQPHNR